VTVSLSVTDALCQLAPDPNNHPAASDEPDRPRYISNFGKKHIEAFGASLAKWMLRKFRQEVPDGLVVDTVAAGLKRVWDRRPQHGGYGVTV
jgi:hypothetical protein